MYFLRDTILKIDVFHNDFSDTFTKCGCDDFREDYYRSITYYLYSGIATTVISILHSASMIIICLKAGLKEIKVTPTNENGTV